MKKKSKLPKSITIIGRRWFQRGPGNTYCTAQIIVDGATIHRTAKEYGYGDHYADIACAWMENNGVIPPREPFGNGHKECHWRYIRDILGIAYEYSGNDVGREKDL